MAPNKEIAMSPTAVPSRITIDFRDAALPSRTWILGVDEDASERIELIAFDGGSPVPETPPSPRTARAMPVVMAATHGVVLAGIAPAAVLADCACPDFCERDHANE
jgi:hypothetical protein